MARVGNARTIADIEYVADAPGIGNERTWIGVAITGFDPAAGRALLLRTEAAGFLASEGVGFFEPLSVIGFEELRR